MLYHFELQMAGVILLGAMLACGIFLYIRRRRERLLQEEAREREMRDMMGPSTGTGGDHNTGDAATDGAKKGDDTR